MECLKRNLFGRNYLASGVFFSNGFEYGIWICDRRLLHLFYILKVVTMSTTKKCIKAVVKKRAGTHLRSPIPSIGMVLILARSR